MATLVTCVVDTGGTGHYTSLSTAEAANFGATGADLVSNGEYVEVTCKCTDGQADTTHSLVNGFTTDSTHTITVDVDNAYRYASTAFPTSGNYYRLDIAGNGAISITVPYITIRNVPVRVTGPGTSNVAAFYIASSNITVDGVKVHGSGDFGSYNFYGFLTEADKTGVKFKRCFVSGKHITSSLSAGFTNGSSATTGTIDYLACTAVGLRFGLGAGGSATIVAKNCAVYDCSVSGFPGTFDASSTNNASDDGTHPGANGVDLSGKAPNEVFHAPDKDDWRPAFSSPLNGRGINLRGEGVTHDLLGNWLPAKPAIGALQPPPPPGPIWQKIKGRWYKIN